MSVTPKSFVVELVVLAATGKCEAEGFDQTAFDKAKRLVHEEEVGDFEAVTPFLQENNCDASVVFGAAVTAETNDALAALICYAD